VLPAAAPRWVPTTLIIWLVSALLGYFVTWGIPPLLSLAASMVLYIVAGKLGWVRGVGHAPTRLRAAGEAAPAEGTVTPRTA
jgi:cytosine permease